MEVNNGTKADLQGLQSTFDSVLHDLREAFPSKPLKMHSAAPVVIKIPENISTEALEQEVCHIQPLVQF